MSAILKFGFPIADPTKSVGSHVFGQVRILKVNDSLWNLGVTSIVKEEGKSHGN
jgi:hypothetical protein